MLFFLVIIMGLKFSVTVQTIKYQLHAIIKMYCCFVIIVGTYNVYWKTLVTIIWQTNATHFYNSVTPHNLKLLDCGSGQSLCWCISEMKKGKNHKDIPLFKAWTKTLNVLFFKYNNSSKSKSRNSENLLFTRFRNMYRVSQKKVLASLD